MSDCGSDVCITCSDQLLRFEVRRVDPGRAMAEGVIEGEAASVSIELVDAVRAGDVLLCHAGVALQRAVGEEEG
ncbi:MAG: HypC/HybG/HupF family hydrogenase formation chaperone [Candidatus Dormibacteria bacterium]